MSRKVRNLRTSSPDYYDKPTIYVKHGGGMRVSGNKKRIIGIWTFRLRKDSEFSPVRFLRRLRASVATALRFVSTSRNSPKVSSSNLMRSRSLVESIESHQAEAIEDCIEFLYSSSSFQRSNSVSASYT